MLECHQESRVPIQPIALGSAGKWLKKTFRTFVHTLCQHRLVVAAAVQVKGTSCDFRRGISERRLSVENIIQEAIDLPAILSLIFCFQDRDELHVALCILQIGVGSGLGFGLVIRLHHHVFVYSRSNILCSSSFWSEIHEIAVMGWLRIAQNEEGKAVRS